MHMIDSILHNPTLERTQNTHKKTLAPLKLFLFISTVAQPCCWEAKQTHNSDTETELIKSEVDVSMETSLNSSPEDLQLIRQKRLQLLVQVNGP